MRSGRSCRRSWRRPAAAARCARAALHAAPALACVVPRSGAGAVRRQGRLQSALHALQRELSAVRAQLLESRTREAQANLLARTDVLTPLENRRAFLHRLRSALERHGRQSNGLAVLYIDLDEFKSVNDRHGHHAGDALLRIVADRLSGCVRSSDAVGRLGGDEFVCLVHDATSRERVSQIACKLFDALSEPYQLAALRLTVRASIGIALSPADGDSAETLLERADAAMYRAKRGRLGYAFFSSDLDLRAPRGVGEDRPAFPGDLDMRARR